jgi:hypothetical protein
VQTETGGPYLPLLLNSVVDFLAEILEKAKIAGHISGVVGHLIPGGGVTHLQYADETMIMVEGSELDIINVVQSWTSVISNSFFCASRRCRDSE